MAPIRRVDLDFRIMRWDAKVDGDDAHPLFPIGPKQEKVIGPFLVSKGIAIVFIMVGSGLIHRPIKAQNIAIRGRFGPRRVKAKQLMVADE